MEGAFGDGSALRILRSHGVMGRDDRVVLVVVLGAARQWSSGVVGVMGETGGGGLRTAKCAA